MRKLLIVSMGIVGFILLLFPWFLILFGQNQLHDHDIPLRDELIPTGKRSRVLAIFPHPDDEVTVAGTLQQLHEAGHELQLVCLTRGEKGKSSGIEDEGELAGLRTSEMESAAALLKVSQLHLKDYPDSGLAEIGLDSLKSVIRQLIVEIQPDVLLSYDSKVGLYGHEDHRLTGLAVEQVFKEGKGSVDFHPGNLYQVTLSPKQIQVALKLSAGFQKNYPKQSSQGLPKPDFAIRTQPYFEGTLEVMQAHDTQKAVLKDLMPFHDKVPVWIYSRIFDREYFHEVK